MSKPSPNKPSAQSHTRRRVKYAVNVTVAVGVAIAITVLINWIGYRQNARFDFTITREYTLSPQTHTILNQLDGEVEIANIFTPNTLMLQRASDLTHEYAHASDKITISQIDLASEPAAFYEQINRRYEDKIQPLRDAIAQAHIVLTDAQAQIKTLVTPLISATEPMEDGDIKQHLLNVWSMLTQFDTRITRRVESLEQELDQPLPNVAGVKAALLISLRDELENSLMEIESSFIKLIDYSATPNATKDALLKLNEKIRPLREQLRQAHEALSSVDSSPEYDQLRATILNTPCVVIFQGDGLAIIPVMNMFPDQALIQQTQNDYDARFIGEERITGALASLSMEQPPLVVFVTNDIISAIGKRGIFKHVAQRLQSAGFDIREWNPKGQRAQFSQQRIPSPAPSPVPGQKVVWIFLPIPPGNTNNLAAMNHDGVVGDLLRGQLEADAGVMVMLMPDTNSRFVADNPITKVLDTWDISAQLDRVILQQTQLPDQRTQTSNQIVVEHWPSDLPITQAMKGMRGIFTQASPLVVGSSQEITHTPIAKLQGNKLWAERNLSGLRSLSDADYDAVDGADAFTVGLASQKGGLRLVVVSDPLWASDDLTTMGQFGKGTADATGAIFPANAELFVNSVLWLSDLDELIAASPRSQDIRRIDAMDDATLVGYRWILGAGMPAAVLLIGITVWMVRRKG